ncbi:MAG TPA: hypothetical protein VEI97_15425 [bacterium]|nr:hypothetical protein [bacterium]
MAAPSTSKAIVALALYLLGTSLAGAVLRTEWTAVAIVGLDLVLYGVYLSTIKGQRDWGDAAVWVGAALVLGIGLAIAANEPDPRTLDQPTATRLVQAGHLWGIGLVILGWWPLRSQGALPGGPVKD